MRPTEARYLSAIGGILLLATITAGTPKTRNNAILPPPETHVSPAAN
jgi:hypothetical protein